MSSHALCLVGGNLSQPKIDSLQASLKGRGLPVQGQKWLSPGKALDLYLEVEGDTRGLIDGVRRALPSVDVALVPLEGRCKQLLVADMDSTLIPSESIVEMAAIAGAEEAVASLTNQAMRGRIDFAEALIDRVKLLEGLEAEAVAALGHQTDFSPGAQTLCATMRAAGARLVLVSGGFTLISGVVAKRLGMHHHVANTLALIGGRLTGGLELPLVDAAMKGEVLADELRAQRLHASDALAVGDGANDLAMIGLAGLGVAYQGKAPVQAAADACINHTDLTTLLYFQGYSKAEFVTSSN